MLSVIALLACWSACAPESRVLPAGLWGGDHIRMVVDRNGAQLEYDCASSSIDQPISLDASGRFSAKGPYKPRHGGPRRDGEADSMRARYVGRVNGETMTLTVTLENGDRVGRFSLTRGVDPLLTKCQ